MNSLSRPALLLALAATLAAPTLRAIDPPPYYVAAILPRPADVPKDTDQILGSAMNNQGDVLLTDQSSNHLQWVYTRGQIYTLTDGGLDLTNGFPRAVAMSDRAADGTFKLTGSYHPPSGVSTRGVVWTVNPDGTSTLVTLNNIILPDGSQAPGEQGDGEGVAVNSAGLVAGSGNSYLLGEPLAWQSPNPAAIRTAQGGDGYTGQLSGVDEAGNLVGRTLDNGVSQFLFTLAGPTGAAVTLATVPYSNGYVRGDEVRAGLVCGEIFNNDVDAYTHAFICPVTGGLIKLPDLLPADTSALTYVSNEALHVNASRDAIGSAQYHTSGSYGANYFGPVFWHHDAATDTYAVFDRYAFFPNSLTNGTGLSIPFAYSDDIPHLTALADDGTILAESLPYSNAAAPAASNQAVVLLKPGADPRPVINNPDPAAGYINIHTEPGQPFTYQFTATNNPTSYRLTDFSGTDAVLPAGLNFNPATGVLSGTGPVIGFYFFSASATNGQGVGAIPTSVYVTSGDAPVVTSGGTASGVVGQPFSFQITATNSPTSFNTTSTLPDGLGLDYSTGLISGTPTKAGTFAVTYQVGNAVSYYNNPTNTLTITIADAPVPPTPTITSPLTASGMVGVPFTYQITTNFTATSYDEVGLPTGLTLNTSTGLISGTPNNFGVGTFTVYLAAGDGGSNETSATLTLTISPSTGPTPTPTPTPGTSPTPTPTPTPAPGSDDLGVTVTVSPEPLVQNALATFHVAVVNQGLATATGVKVFVNYAASLAFVTQGSASVTSLPNNILSLSLPNLTASGTGASTGFDLVFRVNATGGTVSVGATVSGDQDDSNPFNNNDIHITQVNAGTPAAHAPTINAPAGGIILTGQPFSYLITTLGDVAVDSFGATGLPTGLAVDAATGVISGTVADDAAPGAVSVTLSASNGAGRSTSTRTFTVVTTPAKAADVFATLKNLVIKAPTGDGTTGKYKITGSVSLTNQGKKPAKNLKVGLYLSNSPDFSFPVVAGDPSVSQVPVFLDLSNPLKPTVGLTPAGSTVTTINLPFPLAKKGQAGSSLGPVPFTFKIKAKKVNTTAAKYRYLLVVIDPINAVKETNKANNVTVIDLQAGK